MLLAFTPGAVFADVPDKGTTPYVTHFIFRPLQSIDIPDLGTATLLEAVGTTELAGAGNYTAMDIPHNTTWEIKK
jgi:hypothetical protein